MMKVSQMPLWVCITRPISAQAQDEQQLNIKQQTRQPGCSDRTQQKKVSSETHSSHNSREGKVSLFNSATIRLCELDFLTWKQKIFVSQSKAALRVYHLKQQWCVQSSWEDANGFSAVQQYVKAASIEVYHILVLELGRTHTLVLTLEYMAPLRTSPLRIQTIDAAGLALSAWQVRLRGSPARRLTTGPPLMTGFSGGTGRKKEREDIA